MCQIKSRKVTSGREQCHVCCPSKKAIQSLSTIFQIEKVQHKKCQAVISIWRQNQTYVNTILLTKSFSPMEQLAHLKTVSLEEAGKKWGLFFLLLLQCHIKSGRRTQLFKWLMIYCNRSKGVLDSAVLHSGLKNILWHINVLSRVRLLVLILFI